MRDPLLFGLRPRGESDVSKQILAVFRALLFAPLTQILARGTAQAHGIRLLNADEDVLRAALQSGRIQYEAGVFSGAFSAAISRALRELGAALDKRTGVYRLDQARVPAWVVAEATAYRSHAVDVHRMLLEALHGAQDQIDTALARQQINAGVTIGDLSTSWKDAARALEVNPEISEDALQRLRRDYDQSVKLPIQGFAQEEVERLRAVVQESAAQGYRFDRLIPAIEARYEVSKTKATFLARQETSLLVSKFRQARFEDVGVTDYVWMTSHDRRVRDDHKDLDGKRFSYASPPITNKATGARNNPGEDFGCRCIARPVLVGSGKKEATLV